MVKAALAEPDGIIKLSKFWKVYITPKEVSLPAPESVLAME